MYTRAFINFFMSFQVLNSFKNHLQYSLRFSENTVKSYYFDVKLFLEFFEVKEGALLDVLSKLTIESYRSYLSFRIKEKRCKASSNARAISALKCFFKFLKKGGFIKESDISKLGFPKIPKLLPKALTVEEVERICKLLEEGEDWKDRRNEALVFLIYGLGLRISEALSLNRKDFSKTMQFLKIKGKGEKERIIPILQVVKDKINQYINCSTIPLLPDYPLFITGKRDAKSGKPQRLTPREFQKVIANLRTILGLPKFFTPHALRHSFATHIIESGGSIRNMQGLLGHASLSTTQKYVKISAKTLKDSYLKFHPSAM